jgi:hypothetical protein
MWTRQSAPVAPTAPAPVQPSPNDIVREGHQVVRAAYFPTNRQPAKAGASNEPLGLFQETRPNVRALFTDGLAEPRG